MQAESEALEWGGQQVSLGLCFRLWGFGGGRWGVGMHVQDTETHETDYGCLAVAVELDIPEEGDWPG